MHLQLLHDLLYVRTSVTTFLQPRCCLSDLAPSGLHSACLAPHPLQLHMTRSNTHLLRSPMVLPGHLFLRGGRRYLRAIIVTVHVAITKEWVVEAILRVIRTIQSLLAENSPGMTYDCVKLISSHRYMSCVASECVVCLSIYRVIVRDSRGVTERARTDFAYV